MTTKQRILDFLRKAQRDNLAEIVACKTTDRTVADTCAAFEMRVEKMDEEDKFLPILNEMKEVFGF